MRRISEVSRDQVWAVGDYGGQHSGTLIEHWNGRAWKVQPSPNPGGQQEDALYGVAAASASNVWAVGEFDTYPIDNSLVEHWNGHDWKHVSSPDLSGTNVDVLNAVALTADRGVAVGYSHNPGDDNLNGITLLPLALPCCHLP